MRSHTVLGEMSQRSLGGCAFAKVALAARDASVSDRGTFEGLGGTTTAAPWPSMLCLGIAHPKQVCTAARAQTRHPRRQSRTLFSPHRRSHSFMQNYGGVGMHAVCGDTGTTTRTDTRCSFSLYAFALLKEVVVFADAAMSSGDGSGWPPSSRQLLPALW